MHYSASGHVSAAKDDSRFPIGLVFFLVAITAYRALALYVANLPLFLDEAYYFDWSRTLAFGYYSKPPLIAWTIAAATHLCGESELCVRAPALLVHPFTALGLFLVGRHLYSARTGQWAAVLYATLPMVSASSWIMSTDALLLLFWAYGLWFVVRALEEDRWADWIGIGFCVGVGLLAKYTMIAFLLSFALYLMLSPVHRVHLRRPKLYVALLVALCVFLPNVLWNLFHELVSLRHTAHNAALDHSLFHPEKLLAFIGGQAMVFGPVLVAILPFALRRQYVTTPLDWRRRLLLTMSLPLFMTMLGEALAVRANANWAAPSYLGFTLLVAAWWTSATDVRQSGKNTPACVQSLWRGRIMAIALVVNLLAGAVGYHYDALYHALVGDSPVRHLDPYARLRGWRTLATKVQELLAQHPGAGLLGDDRAVLAELSYYLHPRPPTIAVWNPSGTISDQYRLDADIRNQPAGEYMFIARGTDLAAMIHSFTRVQDMGTLRVPTHRDSALEYHVYWVQHFLGYRD